MDRDYDKQMNITNNITIDLYKDALYNPSCIAEMEKFQSFCTNFRVMVINSVTARFKIALFMLIFFVILRFIIDYTNLRDTNFFIVNKFHIDWIIMLLAIFTIALMFL
jgi:hypothetical protein